MPNLLRPCSLLLLGVVTFGGAGCPSTPSWPDGGPASLVGDSGFFVRPDGGAVVSPVDGGTGNTGDGGIFDGGVPPPSGQVGLDAVTPPTGVLTGGYRVAVSGFGFTPETTRIFFAGVEADQVLFSSEQRVTCRVPAGVAPGPVDVRVVSSLGEARSATLFTYFSPVTVTQVEPSRGTTAGGTEVQLTGESFTPEMIVLLGGRQAVSLEVEADGTRATVVTPPGLPGRTDVVVYDAFGQSELRLGFTYISGLALSAVRPVSVPVGQASIVELVGAGFDDDTSVEIGGVAATIQNRIDESRLRVFVPATLPVGFAAVQVTRPGQSVTLSEGLFVRPTSSDALTVYAAIPGRADRLGGSVVEVVGDGLRAVNSVTVAGVPATSFQALDDHTMELVVPGGDIGVAPLVLSSANDAVTFTQFAYYDALTLQSVSPSEGPVAGGTPVEIRGRGFAAGLEVYVGGLPLTDLVVVDDTTVTGTTPPGASGVTFIEARQADERTRLADAFYYDSALSVLGVKPSRGGMSGGTFVEVRGSGFTRPGALSLFFGNNPASEMEVLSDHLLVARTPLGVPGVVDVRVTVDAQEASASRAFTYFNPEFIFGGTRGGPIDGAVYVTALDAFLGLPVPGLFCFLGTEGTSPYWSVTNEFGQCTLSGPDVSGPQTISIAGDGWEYATFVDIDAAEITLYLQPIALASPPPSSGQPPPIPPPATLRGRVTGFAKEFFDPAALGPDELALAIVVTTSEDEFSGTPDPGGQNVVFQEGGEYFIANARTGRAALVALAGIYNLDTGEFRMRQLGVRRNVFPERGVNLENQDIELNIPLDQTVELSMPDAPVRANGGPIDGPNITRVVPFLRFGGEGALAYTTAVHHTRNHDLGNMPDVPGEMLTFVAGAYTTDGVGRVTDRGTVSLTQGELIATGAGTNWDVADALGTPLVLGQVLVVENTDGSTWATTVTGVRDAGEIVLARRPPFSGTGLSYHIGRPTYPSSVVVQDGNGDLIGGTTIQPVLGLPEPITPLENGVLENRTLRWRPAPGEQPTLHLHYLSQYEDWLSPASGLAVLWTFYIEGARTKVPIPRIPEALADLDVEGVPRDFMASAVSWQHSAIYSPGSNGVPFSYENFGYDEIGRRGRRAWTTDLHLFVHPGD